MKLKIKITVEDAPTPELARGYLSDKVRACLNDVYGSTINVTMKPDKGFAIIDLEYAENMFASALVPVADQNPAAETASIIEQAIELGIPWKGRDTVEILQDIYVAENYDAATAGPTA